MKNLFLLSSAINAKHGIYSPRERFNQTLATCVSIKKRCPNSDIIMVDGGLKPANESQIEKLSPYITDFMFYGDRLPVQEIQKSTNHDIVKNLIEIFMFTDVLDGPDFSQYSRIFKISGRYTLNENFDVSKHVGPIVIRGPYTSQFPPHVTGGIELQYMSRLWSFDISQHEYVAEVYKKMYEHMKRRLDDGGYVDIEHLLYHHLDKNLVTNIEKIGVSGHIAPNGSEVDE
jgi:hypothetical protein